MSLGMRAISWYLRRTRKPLWADAKRFHAHAHGPKAAPQPPRALHQRHAVHERSILGFRHYSVNPRHGANQGVVLYLHGGGYVNEMAVQHWQLVSRMADAGLRVEVPLYGLAPQHHFAQAYAMLNVLYAELLEHPDTQVLLAGDSAGGGLALGFAQSLAAQGLPSPRGLTLLSPWLDISCTNPAIDALEPLDPWLAKPGAILAGQLWARGTDLLDPRLSPLHGPLHALPPMDVYIGTHDILYPDVLLLQQRVRSLDSDAAERLHVTVCPGACHVYPLLPVSEGKHAARQLVKRMTESLQTRTSQSATTGA